MKTSRYEVLTYDQMIEKVRSTKDPTTKKRYVQILNVFGGNKDGRLNPEN